MITIRWPSRANADASFFDWLAKTEACINAAYGEEIVFTGRLNWFSAELCAPLGAILHKGLHNLNTYRFDESVSGEVLKVWAKNGFWEQFGGTTMADEFDTTLTFARFATSAESTFAKYIQRELMPKELPQMNDSSKHRFRNSVQEVFNNAVLHSNTEHEIFICGQRYPQKDRLSFVISDLGNGIRYKVEEYTGNSWEASDAIDWAMQEGNTTKRGLTPGGLGLTWLREFIDDNGGVLIIVSQEGYWQRTQRNTWKRQLTAPFPGTVVLLDINTQKQSTFGSML